MKYFFVFFISIYGTPPSIMPEFKTIKKQTYVKFESKKECENYLTNIAVKRYKTMNVKSAGNGQYLKNNSNTQFVICKEFVKNKS